MSKRKKILISVIMPLVGGLLTIIYCNWRVAAAAKGKMYDDVRKLPHRHVGLLLGTGKYVGSGQVNLYYKYRIEAALKLFNAAKIDYLVISGDNSRKDYNEPEMMRADLMAAGVDSSRIFLDYAGFRTFDSMIRFREIFSQDSAIVISQPFHNERSLYIADKEGIAAIAFNAKDVGASSGLRTQVREKLARVKVFFDYVFQTRPKFLGPKVVIP